MSIKNVCSRGITLFGVVVSIFIFNANSFAQTPNDAESQVKEILEKYQVAIGGKENLDKIKTVETISEIEMMGTKSTEKYIEDKQSHKWYRSSEGGIEGKRENGFDGSRMWSKSNMENGYMDDVVFPKKGENGKTTKLPNEKVDGKDCLVVESEMSGVKGTAKSYYDATTYLLVQEKSNFEIMGNVIEQTSTFSDYRKVGDILVAFSETNIVSGMIITKKIISIKQNIDVDPKIFNFVSDESKKDENKPTESANPKGNKSIKVIADDKTIYKDENGNVIVMAEFWKKRATGNYQIDSEFDGEKLVAMKLRNAPVETAIGAVAPDFAGTLIDGSPIQLSQLKGKVVVMNFWFTECGPCIKEMPELNDLVKKYKGQGVEFVSFTHNNPAEVKEFLTKHPFDFKIVADAQNILAAYKIAAFPTHVVLDRDGKVSLAQFGFFPDIAKRIDAKIAENLASAKKPQTENPAVSKKPEYDQMNPNAIVPEDIKKATFEKVWNTINDTYFDPTFNGVDWKVVKTKYEPQLGDTKTNANLTDLLNTMLGELKVSHLRAGAAYNVQFAVAGTNSNKPNESKIGSIGAKVRWLNNSELTVISVRDKSPAQQAGIKPGYLIKKIDGQTIEQITAESNKENTGLHFRYEIEAVLSASAKLSGDLDKKVSLVVIDEKGKERTLEIGRQDFGTMSDLTFESKQLNKEVGYIKFNIFLGDLLKQFEQAIASMRNDKAIIIDLRGNPGGVGNFTTAIAAMLDKEKRSLGVSQYRRNKQEFAYQGNEKSYQGKVFILIDELSGSSTEVLAGGLQANKRAIIIGTNSVGAVLPSVTQRLPNGGALQYPLADFRTPDGKILEGKGVTPDVEVKLSRKTLLAGRDLVIETALKLAKN